VSLVIAEQRSVAPSVTMPNEFLSFRLGGEESGIDILRGVIALNVRGRAIGAVVDSVFDVLQLGADSIKPAPRMSASADAGVFIGMGCVRSGDVERMLILTDIEALMSSAEMGWMAAARVSPMGRTEQLGFPPGIRRPQEVPRSARSCLAVCYELLEQALHDRTETGAHELIRTMQTRALH